MPKNAKFNSTLYSRAYVYQKYVVEDMNASELGREIGCHPSAVLAAVSRFGIPTKTMSEVIQKIPHTGSSAPRPRAEFKDTLHNKSWVVEHFVNQGLSASDIATLVGCSPHSACEAVYKMLEIDTTTRSPLDEQTLHAMRGRSKAKRLFPDAHPCIVCGDPKGTRNHIDCDTHNNDPSNIEWLCMRHHLMVDKRLTFAAARWFRTQFPDVFLKWHDEILEQVRLNPDQNARGANFSDVVSEQDGVQNPSTESTEE